MKGERRGKKKTKFSVLTVPNRLFSSEKIMKGERRVKKENQVFCFDYAEPPLFF